MIIAVTINGALGLGILIAALFSIVDIDAVVNSPTGYPFMEIFMQALGTARAATGMVSLHCQIWTEHGRLTENVQIVVMVFVIICATNGFLATASRMLWAFARDRAVPGHQWISKV